MARALADATLRERVAAQLTPTASLTLARDLLQDSAVSSSPASLGALLLAHDGAGALAREGVDELAGHVSSMARSEADRIAGELATDGLAGHPDYAAVGAVSSLIDLLLSMRSTM
jgi:hypothetical protein